MSFNIQAKTVDEHDDYYGTSIADPYRWLEVANSADSIGWLNKQHELTESFLDEHNLKEAIQQDLVKRHHYKKPYLSLPFGGDVVPMKVEDYYYFFENSGLQDQPILYRSKKLNRDHAEIVLDTNHLNDYGTVSITNISFDPTGEKLVYGLSEHGSDWVEIKVLNLATGKNYAESLFGCKFTTISWDTNGDGFYYNRYPIPDNQFCTDCHYDNKVYWHQIDTLQSEDVIVYESSDRELALHPLLSRDGQFLIIRANRDFNSINQLHYKDLKDGEDFVPLFNQDDGLYNYIFNHGKYFYIHTNVDAPKGKVIKVNIEQPDTADWQTVIDEAEDTIVSVQMINNRLIVCYLHDAHHKLSIYDLEGNYQTDISLPKDGSVAGMSSIHPEEILISYSSFLRPTKIYRYSLEDGSLNEVFDVHINIDRSKFSVEQYFYPSKDGTEIPIYLVYKKELERNGEHPVILHAYGGFNRARTPSFSADELMWLEDGGIYALANIRGGAEYGEDWHQAGMRENKQNVFDDFIAAAEWLIEEGYTNPSQLAISGRSNGGLLVAACMLQRPELFGAVICEVPVIDMLRYPQFTIGRFWMFEFGSVLDGKEAFDYLYAYSPLHNVEQGKTYPPILVTTADTDTRVDPMHAKKFVATIQATHSGENPALLRVDEHAGHGFGKPVKQLIEEQTDIYTFIYKTLNIQKT